MAGHNDAITSALTEAGLNSRVKAVHALSGGCIHEVLRITLDEGTSVIAKINGESRVSLFEEEANGLEALAATNTVLVPARIIVHKAHGKAVFLMEAIEPAAATSDAWRRFGKELAALHAHDVGERYGFDIHNHLGTTPQPNHWCDDWVTFNALHRLGHQLRLAQRDSLLDEGEASTIKRLIDHLDQIIPRSPKPALLHGDLWSGNALPARDHEGNTRIAVIDPAPSIGDGWADIAMMRLFGGFPHECYETYAANVTDHDNIERRIAVYQLYHVLNHVNIFGRGYASQAMSIARSLV